MESVFGGVLIGFAVSLMLLYNGRVTGISGILGGILNPLTLDKYWRMMFIAGLLTGGLLLKIFLPSAFQNFSHTSYFDYAIGGFLVGFGTLMGNGCTSGHGVCGISRLSLRSLTATIIFITSGVFSVYLFRMFRGEL